MLKETKLSPVFEYKISEVEKYIIKNEAEPWLLLFGSYEPIKERMNKFSTPQMEYPTFVVDIIKDCDNDKREYQKMIQENFVNFFVRSDNNKEIFIQFYKIDDNMQFIACNCQTTAALAFHLYDTSKEDLRAYMLENINEVNDPVYLYLKNDALTKENFRIIERYVNAYKKLDYALDDPKYFNLIKLINNKQSLFIRHMYEYIYQDVKENKKFCK